MSWEIDTSHSEATFSIRHAMVTTVRGQFKVLTGKVEIDEATPANSSIEAQVETASIDTRDANRDGHLTSPDFFDAAKYPVISFKSTKVEPKGDNEYTVLGVLDLHGVQKEISLEAEYAGQAKDAYGNIRAGLSAKGTINRKDFGLSWNAALETGGVLVSENVKLEIDLSLLNKG
jgi:polyisoprenoid-binding protein YceI